MQSGINFRVIFLLSAILLMYCSPVAAQRTPSRGTSKTADIDVRLSMEDTRGAPEHIRVTLMTNSGSIVAERFSSDVGSVTFSGVPSGNYKVRASGIEIEDAEATFFVDAMDQHHFETLQLKRKATESGGSTQGVVSAAELNIPDKAHKEFDKGIQLMKEKDLGEAEKHFAKATEIYPQYAAAYNNRGVVAMRTGQKDEGKRLFEEALRADGNNPGANVNFARCLIMEKKIPEAEKYLQKAISVAPLDAEPVAVLANAQMQAGQLDLALANARKVHTLEHQNFSVAHLIAARILENGHRFDEAADEYRLFLKESPDSPKAENVRAALQSLEKQLK